MSDPSDGDKQPRHGGDLGFAMARYGVPEGGWIDLSTGINPTPYPATPTPKEALTRLPDRGSHAGLIAAARAAYAVPTNVGLVAVPGTEIAIRLLPLIAPEGPVIVAGPTYSSHAEAWRNAGRQVTEVPSLEALTGTATIVVITNPNNPNGRIVAPEALTAVARSSRLLVIDEAFVDVTPEASFIPTMAGTSAVVLRSFGKFYGLPGLRLGFVAAQPAFAARLAAVLGDWPVSGPALAIGEAALADNAWRQATRRRLKETIAALRALLAGHGLRIVGHTDLFALVESNDAAALHIRLAERGIWTRAFADHPRWLRVGLPDANGMIRLAAALSVVR